MVSLNRSFDARILSEEAICERARVPASFQNARICVGVSKTMHSIKLKSR